MKDDLSTYGNLKLRIDIFFMLFYITCLIYIILNQVLSVIRNKISFVQYNFPLKIKVLFYTDVRKLPIIAWCYFMVW